MSEQISLFGDDKQNKDLIKAKSEITKLRKKINYYSDLYYNQDSPIISDYEYDKLMTRLKELEMAFPTLITKSSPTMKIGGKSSNKFSKVTHEVQMQSLNDVFSFEEVGDFIDKIKSDYGKDIKFSVEVKIDGLSVSLDYINGKLKTGSTRGDGLEGEDITNNLLMIDDVKEKLKTDATIELRGEVYISRDNFTLLNERLDALGEKMLSNPRNAAAGTLRQLDPTLVKERKLSLFIFNIQKSDINFNSHTESLDFVKKLGLTIVPYQELVTTKKEILNKIKEIEKLRNTLDFDIDGAVIKVDDLNIRKSLGETTKVPRWAVAYKYPPISKETKIEDIQIQVGRTGKITPLAIVTRTLVAGSYISKCTLHNFDYIKDKDIKIGDRVLIRKAGDVIPEVESVLFEKRNGTEKEFTVPTSCPVCKEPLIKEKLEVDLRCVNSECDAQIYKAIVHFASRDCMYIDTLGEAAVNILLDKGYIKDVSDIYYLNFNDIKNLEGFASLSTSNLLKAIEKSKNNTLDRLLFGLGIRHVGKKAAKIIAENIESIYDLYSLNEKDLSQIKEIGPKIAASIVDFFKKEKTKNIIEKLDKAKVNLKGIKKELLSDKLKDKNVCITGIINNISRNELEKIIVNNAGNVTSIVSKNTDILIAGMNAGSKKEKAKKLGIQIMTIDTFIKEFNIEI